MKVADLLIQHIITEAMIKLPSKLLSKLKQEYHTIVASYLRSRLGEVGQAQIKSDDVTSAALNFALQQFDKHFESKFPGVKPKSFKLSQAVVKRTVGEFDEDDLDPKYKSALEKTKLNLSYEWGVDSKRPLKLIMSFKPEGQLKGRLGQYGVYTNAIELNMQRVKTFSWEDYLDHAQEAFDEDDKKAAAIMKRLLDQLTDRIEQLEGTLEHEMTHYMQYKVFGGADSKQIASSKGKPGLDPDDARSAYYGSQIEFDPWIKSEVKNFKVLMQSIRRKWKMESTPWKPYAELVVGAKTWRQVHDELNLPTPAHIDIDKMKGYSEFFQSLKKSDTTKWRKAVKLFISALQKELG